MRKYIVIVQDNQFKLHVSEVQAANKEKLENYLQKTTENFFVLPIDKFKNIKKLKFIGGDMYCGEEKTEVEDKTIKGIYPLKQISYSIHKKKTEKILKVSYNFKSEKGWVWVSLYISFDKKGYPKEKAYEWLRKRLPGYIDEDFIENTKDAYHFSSDYIKPKQVEIEMNDAGYPAVISEIF